MIDDVSDIADFYGEDSEREQDRLTLHQLEHDLTWRYLARFLPKTGSILEIGAATGRYSLELARRGYSVTAVDLSPELVKECERRVNEAGFQESVRCLVADARDLTRVSPLQFDAVLLMGPMYHLVELADRRKVVEAAFARLRGDGIIVSSFLSRLGLLGDLLTDNPGWIEDEAHVRSLVERGRRPDGAPRGGFRGYFARISEISPLHEEAGFETVALAGVEPVIGSNDESFNRLEGKPRSLWLDLLEEISAEPTVLEASRHILYVGRRPG